MAGMPGDAGRLTHRQSVRFLILQFAALVTALLMLEAARQNLVFNLGEAALGTLTQSKMGDAAAGGRVHCTELETRPCLDAWAAAGKPRSVFWIGNSQLHGINRLHADDKTAVMALHDALRPKGLFLTGYSLPNISVPEEAAVLHLYAKAFDPKLVIIPAVFNGMRGGGVRDSVLPLLRAPGAADRLRGTAVEQVLRPIAREAGAQTSKADSSTAGRAEAQLEAGLSAIWPLWHDRNELRGLAEYAMYVAQHTIFGVSAQTKRSLINPGYLRQMKTLEELVADMRHQGRDVILYVPPLRQDVPGPYIPAEYAQFKSALAAIAARHGAHYADLDGLVEGPQWGMVRDSLFGTIDYDFMHFTARGHARLTAGMRRELTSIGY